MRYRNIETGEVYADFDDAKSYFCIGRSCLECKMPNALKQKNLPSDCHCCDDFCEKHREEALHIMGYEAIDDGEDTNASTKPLGEWTLNECKEFCGCKDNDIPDEEVTEICEKCVLNKICTLTFGEMNLQEKPPLTEDELTICRLFGAKWVSREQGFYQTVMLWEQEPRKETHNEDVSYVGRIGTPVVIADVRPDKFPSVKPGACISLEDCK